MFEYFWAIDFAPLMCAILSGISSSVAGTLLFARRQSMTVDAISHMVLPGMVIAFLISGRLSFFHIFWGALVASVVGVWVVDFLSKNFQHDRAAVLGMVFSFWFAIGIFLLEAFVDSRVHFDVTHILFGSLESNYWLDLGYVQEVGLFSVIAHIPMDILVLFILAATTLFLLLVFFKEIVMVSFDYTYARTAVAKAYLVYYAIPIVVAMVVVASFRLVGLIMILGMFVIPPLFASLFSIHLKTRLIIGMIFSVFICIFGYGIAVYIPIYVGNEDFSMNVGGTIVSAGTILLLIIVCIKELLQSFSINYDDPKIDNI